MRGFTLVEVLVALLLFEVGVLGMVGTLVLASRTLGAAERLDRAVVETQRVVDSLASAPSRMSGTATFPGGLLSWDVAVGMEPLLVTAVDLDGDTLLRLHVPDGP